METMKSRSESPYSRSKAKSHSSDTSENGSSVVEQVKRKKKNLRNKNKLQSNGKETGEPTNTGKDYFEDKTVTTNEVDRNADTNNAEHENGISQEENIENGNGQEEVHEMDENRENDALVSTCGNFEENVVESNGKPTEIEAKEYKSTESENVIEESTKQCNNSETESSAKKDSIVAYDSLPESEVACESTEETFNQKTPDVFNEEAILTPEQGSIEECAEVKDSSHVSVNGSEGSSHYEEANSAEDNIQASPDTATKDDVSISHKITNFLGKWNYSQQKSSDQFFEQKQDCEVSSMSKIEESTVSHPYLSKVSGRRGIRDRLNSSASVLGSREAEVKTPDNSGKISLDDSFRVRTNPPRLHSLNLTENPTLRKFKGKRCLNAGDEPEEEDMYFSTIKRRKVDEKASESGLLGSILWSPFKKKQFENEDQTKLATTESKLSRLLSPFWFWKKTAAGQKGK